MPRRDDLVGLDLPLLAALKELLDSESVTVAARRLGTTQPALSRTLARLRTLFQDPLLVPVGRKMQRTARGRDLQPRVDRALDGLRALAAPPAPAASEERRTVRIAASDYATAVVLHPWIARLRREEPGTIVHIEPVGAWTIDPLAYGELDLAIGPRIPVEGLDQFVFRKVLEDRMVCALRKGHPAARGKLTLRGYLALEHVMVGALLPHVSTVQVALHDLGKTRTVVARVPTYLSALRLVAATDLAVAVPERMLEDSCDAVVSVPLPFQVEAVSLNLLWHPRRTTDPQHRLLRESILSSQARIGD
ncbi:MAG TPA: LysR family transcriptional regulator [Polyangiaceae bacterium]|jgi:DNA-binding transcriptional LysR family regulator